MKLVYCAGDQARVLLDVLRRLDTLDDVVILDDDDTTHGQRIGGVEVRGGFETLDSFDQTTDRCLVATGSIDGARTTIADRLEAAGFSFFNALDPDATLSNTARIGAGVTVTAQSYVGPGVDVDDHVLVDSAANVSHDVHLERGATLAPMATVAGGAVVGEDAYVGTGATVVDHVTVGEAAVVGAGATVTGDVPPETTVVGTPAAPI